MSHKLTLQDCINFAESKGGKCLSKKYINIISKMKWQCEYGHVWFVSFNNIKNKETWCPKCSCNKTSKRLNKYNYETVCKYIENKKGILLSKEYINTKQKLKVKCLKCNKIWFPTFKKILFGQWCRHCNKIDKYNYIFVKKEISKRDGTLLTKKYNGNKQKLDIRCNKCNLVWSASFNCIKNHGSWCPSCSVGREQKKLFI